MIRSISGQDNLYIYYIYAMKTYKEQTRLLFVILTAIFILTTAVSLMWYKNADKRAYVLSQDITTRVSQIEKLHEDIQQLSWAMADKNTVESSFNYLNEINLDYYSCVKKATEDKWVDCVINHTEKIVNLYDWIAKNAQ